uniref:Uncharacterized protein n=1 Tax=Leptocylindrus danicus TaxID=163516 RepID=A0A7S2PHQ3_9STRA|mmetsp:Transcript_33986/g.49245  ORF Transcript_33986/g.49245 Transcript_33986/m.49245 type:complete len:118 (+) Transcript_33986:44-397(+)
MMMNCNIKLLIWVTLASNFVLGFMPGTGVRNVPLLKNSNTMLRSPLHKKKLFSMPQYKAKLMVQYSQSNSDNGDDDSAVDSNFDGKGFAGYLAPYAFALLVSVGVTAAFVKFVLLDY